MVLRRLWAWVHHLADEGHASQRRAAHWHAAAAVVCGILVCQHLVMSLWHVAASQRHRRDALKVITGFVLSAGALVGILILMPARAQEPYRLDDPIIQQLIHAGRLQRPSRPALVPPHGESTHQAVDRWLGDYWPEYRYRSYYRHHGGAGP